MIEVLTPISDDILNLLNIGDQFRISGYIYTGRDAVLPRIAELIKNDSLSSFGIDLHGSVVFHTAVSMAGVGPTSSNKLEIEESIPTLSTAGVKIHLGKGAISAEIVKSLFENNSIYAVIPPVTALLQSKILEQRIVAFPELGMEAFHIIKVNAFPAIVAAAKGKSIY